MFGMSKKERLLKAIHNDDEKRIKSIFDKGINLKKDNLGNIAMGVAITNNNVKLMKNLIDNGVNLNKNATKFILLGCCGKQLEALKFMISKGLVWGVKTDRMLLSNTALNLDKKAKDIIFAELANPPKKD